VDPKDRLEKEVANLHIIDNKANNEDNDDDNYYCNN